ncbi:hypothetical protein ACFSWE_15985 [Leucobacter albus]|uniref:Excreted virulence factor EspC (Type VII ESX diderm) n=1 Tax=Leucobacter albus TaxID=272210 RepID=A0ABW3TNM2_9MICO
MIDETLINSLKDSAVDAWVVSESGYSWAIRGGVYFDPSGSHTATLTRPSGGGGGGVFALLGEVSGEATAYYQECFEQVRSTVDAILEPWREVPDDLAFRPPRNNSKAAVDKYGSGMELSTTGEVLGANPGLATPLTNPGLALADMSGGAIRTMEEALLAKLAGVVNAFGVVAQVRLNAITVQRSIWSGVNRKVPEIVRAIDGGMRAIAEHNTPTLEKGLGQFAYLLDVAGLLPGAAGKFAGMASKLAKVSEDAAGADRANAVFWHPTEAGTYSALINELSRGLKNLDSWIAQRESRLATQMREHMAAIGKSQGEFDLRVPEASPTGTELAYNPEVIENLIAVELPALAAELTAVAETSAGCLVAGAADRRHVGRTPAGAAPEIDELTYLLRAVTLDLAGEVAESALTVRAVLDDLVSVEQSVMDSVARYLAELDDARVRDPLLESAVPADLPPLSPAIPGLLGMMAADDTQ